MSKVTLHKDRSATIIKCTSKMIATMLLSSLMTIGGCNTDKLGPIERIRQDWEEQFGSELWFIHYGTHNGYVAIFIPREENVAIDFKIAGTIFRYHNNFSIYLWKGGSFYEMIDAYLQGLITSKDISKIGESHIEMMRRRYLYESDESFNEWYFNLDTIRTIIL